MARISYLIALIFATTTVFSIPLYDYNNTEIKCPETTSCSCSSVTGELEIECPVPISRITIRVQPSTYIHMECSDLDESEYEKLPIMHIGNVSTVKIRRCPLPTGRPIKSMFNNLGTKHMKTVTFQSPNTELRNTLVRHHLEGLEDLQRLALSGNGLSELPEDLFDDVTNLIWLDLKSNKVHLPKNIFAKLEKLESLELGYNNLQYLEQGVFRYQKRLKLLNLWGNKLTNLTKECFDGVSSLLELDLSSNTIETFHPDVFSTLINLVNLNLNANHFKSLPENLFQNNKKLMKIRMMENRIPLEALPSGFLSNLGDLENVLIKCELSTVPGDLFSGSSNITHIDFERNHFTTLPENLFSDQRNLQQLNLKHNNLSYLPDGLFIGTRALTVLKLSYNQLTNVSGPLFGHLRTLTELYLDNNHLQFIHRKAFSNLKSLEVLELQNNQLTLMDDFKIQSLDIIDIISPFNSLLALERLNLRNNSITTIFPDWTTSLNALKHLDLSYNKITMLSSEHFQFLSSTLNVNLTHNEIFEVDLKELETIAISQNQLSDMVDLRFYIDFNPIYCNCVILHFNKFLRNELAPETRKMIKIIPGNLKCVGPDNLNGKRVKDVNPKELLCPFDSPQSSEKRCPNKCTCMVRPDDRTLMVDCSNADLTEVPDLPNSILHQFLCTEFNISFNQIKELPIVSSNSYINVREIYAQNNTIKKISIENIPEQLRIIDLSNNKLKEMNSTVFEKLNKTRGLSELRLSGNPWKCNCETLDLYSFVLAKFNIIKDFNSVRCSTGEAIYKLSAGDFCPAEPLLVVVICVCTIVIGILIGLIAAVYYQTEIKVWLFAHNVCLWFVTEEELDKDKKYDAFISYSHKDEEFVTEQLVPQLENGSHPFKLCLHIRDWIVGEWIPTQIATSVDDSRRTIVVLSPNFLESVWGRMEFRTAHQNALKEGRARVIVVIIGEIGNTDHLDDELKAYLKTNTYVKWGDPWFWDKLRYAMPHPVGVRRTKGLVKNGIKSSIDDKLELIKPLPVTPTQSTPPAESAGQNPLVMKLNGENGRLPNGLNGHVNGAFIINTSAKQSDV